VAKDAASHFRESLVGMRDEGENTGTRGRGDTGKRGHGDAETRRPGDTGTRGHGDAETRGNWDMETRRHGDPETPGPGDTGTPEERYSLTDQMRRSSRSVCTNIGEAWRKRRYPAHFVSKMSDSEGEAEETRVWVEIAERCKYLTREEADSLDRTYDEILAQLVNMIVNKDDWVIRQPSKSIR
jgi:four helix bundle protein